MKKAYTLPMALAMAVAMGTATPSGAADAQKGKLLHDPSCMTNCHSSRANGDANGLYTRKKRLTSLEKLKSQVSFCNQQVLNTEWWPEDEANVVKYLNREFYKFQ